MSAITLKELVEFYPAYFSDKTLEQSCQEVALVYSQSEGMRQELREILAVTEGLLIEKHPILIEIFIDTSIFIESDNDENDFKQIANLIRQIKQKIFEFWQPPVPFKPIVMPTGLAKTDSEHFQVPDITLVNIAVSMLLNLYQEKSQIGEVQIQRVLSMVESMNKNAITNDNRDFYYRVIGFLVDESWDILRDKNNRCKREDIIRRVLM